MKKFYDSEYLPAGATWKMPTPKVYFTKYLPVKGEIKEGYCLDTKKGEVIYYNGNYGDPAPQELKPVKLFLCSRDIQVGDKVKGILPSGGYADYTVEFIDSNPDIIGVKEVKERSIERKDLFKVIGEISPNATFVSEGQEFEEDDFEKWTSHVDTSEEHQVIKVKCKCCGKFS